jgi:hypothetical protein
MDKRLAWLNAVATFWSCCLVARRPFMPPDRPRFTDSPHPYPLQERPLSLASGRVVQLYNIVSMTSPDRAPSFGVQYRSSIAAADEEGRKAEAIEVIAIYADFFAAQGATSGSAQLCATRAQAEMREPPEMIFQFERAADTSWHYVATVRPSSIR